jgi:hypothetical protein
VKLGWCITGHHQGRDVKYSRPCPGIVHNIKCSCDCHGKTKVVASKHRRIRRKKGSPVFTERPTVATINYEDAVLISKRLIEEKGEDFKYTPENATTAIDGGCVYFVRDQEQQVRPSCLVGHIIDQLAENKDKLVEVFLQNGYNGINIEQLIATKLVKADEQTAELLTVLQVRQDGGATWAEALHEAIEQSSREVKSAS